MGLDPDRPAISGRQFRDVLGHYPTGVSLITGISPEGDPVGLVVGSFTSVSLDPPLIAYLPTTSSYTHTLLRQSSVFVVNVLASGQEDVCRTFASKAEDKWRDVRWRPSSGGAPILEDALAWIECTIEREVEAGDHYIVLGRVLELAIQQATTPLLFFQGGYGRFTMTSMVALSAPDLAMAIRDAETARPDIEKLSARLGVSVELVAEVGSDLVFIGQVSATGKSSIGPTLGTRIPLMAPLGEQYVAWLSEDAISAWLDRAGITEPEDRAALADRLRIARERGWSMSRISDTDETPLYEAIREFGSTDLLPAHQRELKNQIAKWSDDYEPVDVSADSEYAVHSIAVPVFGKEGTPLFILRISDLPKPILGSQIQDWVERMKATAERMSQRLVQQSVVTDVVGWG